MEKNGLGTAFDFLSDPELKVAEAWGVPVMKNHPQALKYPRKAFLQPSVFIFDRSGRERFGWRSRPRFLNLFGAARRITPSEVLTALDRCRAEPGG